MPNPQQPELRRSEKSAVDQDAWQDEATSAPPAHQGRSGPVPPDNAPGHRPDRDQDKPVALGGAGYGSTSEAPDQRPDDA
jgi:hypothetical protein